jgi:hypothetical protein
VVYVCGGKKKSKIFPSPLGQTRFSSCLREEEEEGAEAAGKMILAER